METRQENGEPYCPSSLSNLLYAIQRHICEYRSANKLKPFAILEKTKHDPAFDPLHKCLDSVFRKLHNSGVGAKPKQARVITHDEEHTLWESSILGDKTPESLLHAVFYLNGLNFCLRGGEEHRQLKITQLQRMTVPDPDNPGQMIDCYEYTEFGSKNRSGGLNQVYLRNKGFRQYAAKNASRCHVRLIDLYLDKLPAYI